MLSFEDATKIVEGIRCQDYIVSLHDNDGKWYLQVSFPRTDCVTLEEGVGSGGKYYVSPWSTESEIVQKALGACIAYAEHEVREWFTYEGVPVFNPHLNIRKLMSIADRSGARAPAGVG